MPHASRTAETPKEMPHERRDRIRAELMEYANDVLIEYRSKKQNPEDVADEAFQPAREAPPLFLSEPGLS